MFRMWSIKANMYREVGKYMIMFFELGKKEKEKSPSKAASGKKAVIKIYPSQLQAQTLPE